MKKNLCLSLFLAFFIFSTPVFSQIQKSNILAGADIANFDLGLKKGTQSEVRIDPKLAFFIKDNVAIGAYILFDLTTGGASSTTINYGVGALGRYYFSDKNNMAPLRHSRFFIEGTVGLSGKNINNGSSTNGLGIGVGPGYAYFITPNIGLETLLKYNGLVGFGSATYQSDLNLNVGFQIYLPSKRTKSKVINDVK